MLLLMYLDDLNKINIVAMKRDQLNWSHCVSYKINTMLLLTYLDDSHKINTTAMKHDQLNWNHFII